MTRSVFSFAAFIAVASSSVAFAQPNAAAVAPNDGGSAPLATSSDERVEPRVAAFGTVALGMPTGSFVNELVGARLELEYTPRFAFGMSLAYANMKGKDGRVSNVLPEASVAYRLPLGQSSFGIPIRFAGGYLPKNGPTLRLSSGFDLELGEKTTLELALLEPMVWVVRDRPELSLNFGALVRANFQFVASEALRGQQDRLALRGFFPNQPAGHGDPFDRDLAAAGLAGRSRGVWRLAPIAICSC